MPSSFLRQLDQGFDLVLLAMRSASSAPAMGSPSSRAGGYGDVLPGLLGISLLMPSQKHVAHVQHAAHVADRRARSHGAEGGDLADGVPCRICL
jgi:hypothetical protein